MKIELGKRYKTRNGRIAFVSMNDLKNALKYRFGGVLATNDNFEYADINWLENGICSHHPRKTYGINLEDFDLIECLDGEQLVLDLDKR